MKKVFAFLLSFTLVFVSISFIIPDNVAHAATQQELEDKISELDDEISKNKDILDSLKDKKESQQEYLDTLEKQISAVEDKVSTLETQISSLDEEIDSLNNKIKQLNNEIAVIKDEINAANEAIDETNEKIDSSKDLLAAKLRAAYINGNESTLKILMGSDSLSGFLTSLEMMKRMSEDDKKVINDFKETVTKLQESKATLETKQSELTEKTEEIQEEKDESVSKKKELVSKQNEYSASVKELESSYATVEKYISDLDKNSAVYENYIKTLQEERAQADAEIDAIIKAYQATTQPTTVQSSTLPASNNDPTAASSSGGSQNTTAAAGGSYASNASWAWPLGNASCYISSGYGYRSASISGTSFHGGIDITGGGIYGKPIYASRAGTVIKAAWGNTGYGNYVIIDHGDGFVSLYGHCSSLSVSTGQSVSKGQHIANVGSTGNSTGPHLHFEVRYNGTKVNPLNYVKKP
ncbi:MAG: murein hydrolase activator EnvC family protein [Acutalibacteraceae bacterium]